MLGNHAIRAVEEQDPSLDLGYEIIYDKSLSLEFRNFERQEAESRLVHLRVLIKKDGWALSEVRFEMFDDADLFFFIEATITGDDFEKLKKEDQLLLEFSEFPGEVIRMLEDSMNSSDESSVKFIVEDEDEGSGVLQFDQILEIRSVEIFHIKFERSEPLFIQTQAQFRYSTLAFNVARQKAMCVELNKQMHAKNPVLLKTITGKSPQRH